MEKPQAPVVQRIEYWSSEPTVGVRFPPGADFSPYHQVPQVPNQHPVQLVTFSMVHRI